MKKTLAIDGQTLTLEAGQSYLALGDPSTCEVEIRDKSTNAVAHRLTAASREAQNRFLAAFNNGASSFSGRVW